MIDVVSYNGGRKVPLKARRQQMYFQTSHGASSGDNYNNTDDDNVSSIDMNDEASSNYGHALRLPSGVK